MSSNKTIDRVETFDLLRGYFLLVILLNHMHFYPSGYEYITGQSFMYASTAEGFFLISGIVLGIVRGAKLIDKPFKDAAKLLLKRSVQLYITYIILVLFFTLVAWFLLSTFTNPGIKSGIFQPVGDFWTMTWKALALQYTYGWADFLRLYAIFILFSPIALWLLRKGLWYIVIALSIGVWALYPISGMSPWLSMPLSWQLIFFVGFVIGFHWNSIKEWWANRALALRKAIIGTVVPLAGITLVAGALLVFGHGIPGVGDGLAAVHNEIAPYFNKDRLPLARLLIFGLWFFGFYWLFQRFEKPIKKWLGWLLLPFGHNSLYVYTIQAFVVFAIMLLYKESPHWWANFLVSTLAIALVYLAVRTKFLMKIIPR